MSCEIWIDRLNACWDGYLNEQVVQIAWRNDGYRHADHVPHLRLIGSLQAFLSADGETSIDDDTAIFAANSRCVQEVFEIGGVVQ